MILFLNKTSATVFNKINRVCLNMAIFVMLFIAIVFPTGQFYGVNIKLIIIAVVVGLLAIDLAVNRKTYLTLLYCIGSYILFILVYSCWGIYNGSENVDVITHVSAISGTFLIVFLPYYAMKIEAIGVKTLFDYIINISILHCLIKVFVEMLLLLKLISIKEFQVWLYSVFNFEVITLDFGGLIRINSANDFVIPVCIYGLLVGKRYGLIKYANLGVGAIMTLFVFCTYLTYSRYLWVMGGIAFIFGIIILSKGINNKRILIMYAICLSIATIVIISFLPEQLSLLDLIARRYTGIDAESSDLDRLIMRPLLYMKFLESPYIGHGLGAYVEYYVRFDYLPWNYELQWLALLMQVGIFGVIYQSAYFVFIFKKLFLGINLLTFGLYTILLLVLVSGFFNCFIFTSAMGVVFLYLIVMAIILNICINDCTSI